MSSLADESFVILGSSPTQSADEVSLDLVSSLSLNSMRKSTESKGEDAVAPPNKDAGAQRSSQDAEAVVEGQAMRSKPSVSTSSISAKDLMIWSRPFNSSSQSETNHQSNLTSSRNSSAQLDHESISTEEKKTPLSSNANADHKEPIPTTSKGAHTSHSVLEDCTTSKEGKNLAASFIMGEISADQLKVLSLYIGKSSDFGWML